MRDPVRHRGEHIQAAEAVAVAVEQVDGSDGLAASQSPPGVLHG